MSDSHKLGAVLKREIARLEGSPRVKRWAREMRAALDELDEHLVAFAAVVGIGVVFAVSGYGMSSAGLRELLDELTGDEVPR